MDRKPLNGTPSSDSAVTDGNFDVILFTKTGAYSFTQKRVAHMNRMIAKTGSLFRYKLIDVKDCGTHWRSVIM